MALDKEQTRKPFRELRKALKGFAESPSPEQVHTLRTHTRRVEAAARALIPADQSDNLLKALKPIRKAAGTVRDLDVFIGYTASLSEGFTDEHLILLIEQLGERRTHTAQHLHQVIDEEQEKARRSLRRCLQPLKDEMQDQDASSQLATQAISRSLELTAKLSQWPRLTRTNLHAFRLKVKELRYVLQLAEGGDTALSETLGQVKDSIGAWHDWSELTALAEEILHESPNCPLIRHIKAQTRKAFTTALAEANNMRVHFRLQRKAPSPEKGGGRKPPASQRPSAAILSATSRLAG